MCDCPKCKEFLFCEFKYGTQESGASQPVDAFKIPLDTPHDVLQVVVVLQQINHSTQSQPIRTVNVPRIFPPVTAFKPFVRPPTPPAYRPLVRPPTPLTCRPFVRPITPPTPLTCRPFVRPTTPPTPSTFRPIVRPPTPYPKKKGKDQHSKFFPVDDRHSNFLEPEEHEMKEKKTKKRITSCF